MLARFVIRRIIAGIVVLFAITYFAFFAQDVAMRQRRFQPAPLGAVAAEAWHQTATMWKGIAAGDLGEYSRRSGVSLPTSQTAPLADLIKTSFWNSSVLLLLSMALGGLLGGLLGIAATAFRRRSVSVSLLLLSIAGVSTPSFFLAVLLQFGAIEFYKKTGTRLVPVGGFGLDAHLVLPVLVLSARPIAQVARLTSAYLENLINQDFVRTARAKGLTGSEIWFGHILPNAAGSVLTAMASSVRFSLSSLPVVEMFFGWPGLGSRLLERLQSYDTSAAAGLVLATGLFFVLVNTLLDVFYRVLDPRLRTAESAGAVQMETGNWLELAWTGIARTLTLRGWRERRQKQKELAPLPVNNHMMEQARQEMSRLAQSMRWGRLRAWRRATIGNPALALGAILGLGLLVVILAGPQLSPHNPYFLFKSYPAIGTTLGLPPYPPSGVFPLGTDSQGRDILSLLLVGARRTMMLAFLAVAGRLVIGGIFGFLAGWFHNTLLDRSLMALGEMANSFPALLLATLVVYAVGIRQGLSAFIFGLLVIGWPEVMQNIRAQVISVRPMAYIEGAVATGAGQGQILTRHVLPNIWPTMVSLAFLEMGGALMILGELGFLGVFIGGGFAAEGEAVPTLTYYDIPEWGVMLANSWRAFRSVPWAMIYPALAFFVAIVTFALLGEGLRRMSEELTLSMKTLFNRYSLLAVIVIGGIVLWTFQSTGLWARYKPLANTFNTERALADVQTLASPQFGGRQIGTEGADDAADWIARQFDDLGLVAGGEDWTYFQTIRTRVASMTGTVEFQAWDRDGQIIPLTISEDFAEPTELYTRKAADADAEIIYVAVKSEARVDEGLYSAIGVTSETRLVGAVRSAAGFSDEEAVRTNRVLLVEGGESWLAYPGWWYAGAGDQRLFIGASAVLVIDDDPLVYIRRDLPGLSVPTGYDLPALPMLYVTSAAADSLLAGSGHALAELRERRAALADGQGFNIPTGVQVKIHFPAVEPKDIAYRNVIAMWPGEDVARDNEMVILMAYYDGLGSANGTLYPGASDNASGVAALLEIIRSWKEWEFKPKRTVLLVAWAGGELYQSPEAGRFLTTRSGMGDFKVVGVFEVEGIGAGTGNAPLMWRSSSDRVSEIVQTAARQLGIPLTIRGAGLHAAQYSVLRLQTNYPMLTLTWPGADAYTHLPTDTANALDLDKLGRAGRILSLVTAVMASDPAY